MSVPDELGPKPVVRLPPEGFDWNTAVLEPYADIATGDSDLATVDVSSPASPVFVDTSRGIGRSVCITVHGGHLLVAGRTSG